MTVSLYSPVFSVEKMLSAQSGRRKLTWNNEKLDPGQDSDVLKGKGARLFRLLNRAWLYALNISICKLSSEREKKHHSSSETGEHGQWWASTICWVPGSPVPLTMEHLRVNDYGSHRGTKSVPSPPARMNCLLLYVLMVHSSISLYGIFSVRQLTVS